MQGRFSGDISNTFLATLGFHNIQCTVTIKIFYNEQLMVSRYHESNGLWMQLSRLAGEAGMIGQLENGIWERFLPVKKKQHSEISNSRAYFQMRCVAFNPGLQGRHDEKMYCLITAKLTFHALKPEGLQCKNRWDPHHKKCDRPGWAEGFKKT